MNESPVGISSLPASQSVHVLPGAGLFQQNFRGGADTSFEPPDAEFLLKGLQPFKPVCFCLLVDFIREKGCPGPRPWGIAEGVAGHEVDSADHGQRILKIFFSFTGEAHDEVGRESDIRAGPVEVLNEPEESCAVITAVHTPEDPVGSRLHGQVQPRTEVIQGPEKLYVFLRHILGMRRDVAQAFQTGNGRNLTEKRGETCAVSRFVESEGIHVLAEEGDFQTAAIHQCAAFIQYGSA